MPILIWCPNLHFETFSCFLQSFKSAVLLWWSPFQVVLTLDRFHVRVYIQWCQLCFPSLGFVSLTDIFHGQNGAQHFELPAQPTLVAMFWTLHFSWYKCIFGGLHLETKIIIYNGTIHMEHRLSVFHFRIHFAAGVEICHSPYKFGCVTAFHIWTVDIRVSAMTASDKPLWSQKGCMNFLSVSVMVSCDVICGACFAGVWKLPIYNADSLPF